MRDQNAPEREHWSFVLRFLKHPHWPDLSRLAPMVDRVGVLAGFAAATILCFLLLTLLARVSARRRLARAGRLYELRLPEEFDRARLAQMLRSLAAELGHGIARPWVGFELHAEAGRIRPLVFTAGLPEPRLHKLIGEALPGARLEPITHLGGDEIAKRSLVCSLAPTARDHAPLETTFTADPVGLLLRSLGDTRHGETSTVQLLVTGAPRRAQTRLLADASRLRIGQRRHGPLELVLAATVFVLKGFWEVFDSGSTATRSSGSSAVPQPGLLDRERMGALMEKAREPLFACSLRLAAAAPTRRVAGALLGELRNDYHQYSGFFNRLRRYRELSRRRRFARRLPPPRPPLLLSASELAALCPFPERLAEAPVPLRPAPAREIAPTPSAPAAGIRLGTSEVAGRRVPVFVAPRSLLQHVHLMGATGAGKSTTLLNMAVEVMSRGLGLLLVEPKGDLVEEALRRVPRRRLDDVILLDFADPEFPPAFNLLAGGPGQGEAVAGIFSRVFGGNWGPRSDDLLRAAILTLEGGSGDGMPPTLADVLPLLTDPRRRRRYRVTDTVVLQGFWKTWDTVSEGQRQQALAPLANKLRALLLRPPVRDALVQPESPDLRAAIRDGKIILCSLPSGAERMGEDGASLFGSVLLHRVWQAAQSLGPSTTRSPFLCLVDEAHRFTALPAGMSEVLSQARGYGLGMVLAHQQLIQLSPELRETVAVNCRTKLCFQLDPPDNERMARHFEPQLTAADLLHLDRYQLAVRTVEDGLVLPAATAAATPPPQANDDNLADLIKLRKRLTSRSKQDVEALIAERFPELEQPGRGEVTLDGPVDIGPPGGTFRGTPDVPPDVPRIPRRGASTGDPGNPDSSYNDEHPEDRPWAA